MAFTDFGIKTLTGLIEIYKADAFSNAQPTQTDDPAAHAACLPDTWDGATFSSLGLTPGSYEWTWGSGATADTFTLDIEAPAPEPASLTLLGAGLIGLILHLLFLRRRHVSVKAA
jgi:hypothetical protein